MFCFFFFLFYLFFFFFSSRRRHTRSLCDWSSDVCSSDLSTFDLIIEYNSNRIGLIGKYSMIVTKELRCILTRTYPGRKKRNKAMSNEEIFPAVIIKIGYKRCPGDRHRILSAILESIRQMDIGTY